MFKAKKKNVFDKISDVEYFEIPIINEKIPNDHKIEIRYSKNNSLQAAILFFALTIISIYQCIKSPSMIIKHPIGSIIIIGFILAGLITFLITYYRDSVILRLTIDTFEYNDQKIRWKDIRNMYLKEQSVDLGVNHDIIIEVQNEKEKSFSLNSLDRDYKTILYEIGRCYGNYMSGDDKNAIRQ
jgi:hypothetical protein